MANIISGIIAIRMTTDEKIDKLAEITAKGFEDVNVRLTGVESRLDGVDGRMDSLESKFEAFQHETREEFRSVRKEMRDGFKVLELKFVVSS